MTDAAHLLSDVSGFAVAVFASFYAMKRSSGTHTFGCAPLCLVHLLNAVAASGMHRNLVYAALSSS
jgi:zinc transporter 2